MIDIRRRWHVFTAVAIGTFMSTLDSSIVNVSLPTISHDFGIDVSIAQWVVLSYLITVAALLLPAGAFVDLVGRARSYVGGLALFAVGSLLCGLAPGEGALIASRALQALGAALAMATGAALLVDAWPGEQRGRVMGLMGMIVSVGLMTGPPLGGLISGALGWRWIFYVNLPISVVGIGLATFALRGTTDARGRLSAFDVPGALTLGLSMVALCLALTLGPRAGWGRPGVVALLAASPVLLGAFVLRQATAKSPMLRLSLFHNATFSSASISSLLNFTGSFPVVLFLPFYLQGVRGYSATATGLTIFTIPLLTAVLAPITGRLSDRIGTLWPTVTGMTLATASYAVLMTLGVRASHLHIVIPLAMMGLANASFGPANQSALMGSVPPENRGIASGMANAMRSLGMVIGAAAGTAIAAARAISTGHMGSGRALDAAAEPAAFVHGFHAALVLSITCAIAAAIAAATRPNDARRKLADPAPEPALPAGGNGQ
ncbi:MAG: DHA2 family efflux MFS transporter permease subunit [Armatimonadetes bacterium]|nr:DHA2 family efflux MFS transporter permease subunit [Armatimonadota bacterium]